MEVLDINLQRQALISSHFIHVTQAFNALPGLSQMGSNQAFWVVGQMILDWVHSSKSKGWSPALWVLGLALGLGI